MLSEAKHLPGSSARAWWPEQEILRSTLRMTGRGAEDPGTCQADGPTEGLAAGGESRHPVGPGEGSGESPERAPERRDPLHLQATRPPRGGRVVALDPVEQRRGRPRPGCGSTRSRHTGHHRVRHPRHSHLRVRALGDDLPGPPDAARVGGDGAEAVASEQATDLCRRRVAREDSRGAGAGLHRPPNRHGWLLPGDAGAGAESLRRATAPGGGRGEGVPDRAASGDAASVRLRRGHPAAYRGDAGTAGRAGAAGDEVHRLPDQRGQGAGSAGRSAGNGAAGGVDRRCRPGRVRARAASRG